MGIIGVLVIVVGLLISVALHECGHMIPAKKFGVLRKYLDGYNLQGGIVRQDKQSGELCICVDKYSDNIHDENWQLLSEVL